MDKPINKIENRIYEIDRTIKSIRVDVSTIKADLKIIKDAIAEKEKKEKEISKGWFFS
jgi:archaellum component FlaC